MTLPTALAYTYAAIDAASDDPLHRAKCRALMLGYHEHYKGRQWRVVSLETTTTAPVLDPSTGKPSGHHYAGKDDGIIAGYGGEYLLEHKSTANDIGPDSAYWRRVEIDSQISGYMLRAAQNGRRLNGCLYDVIRKPTISPKLLSKTAMRKILSEAAYCGSKLSPEEYFEFVAAIALRNGMPEGASSIAVVDLLAPKKRVKGRVPRKIHDTRETPALFQRRLAADTFENPEKYYQRKQITRLDHELLEFAEELHIEAQDIARDRKNGTHPRSSGACMSYGRPCVYLGICSGQSSPDDGRWMQRECVHPELEIEAQFEDGGRKLLTNSRIKCKQLCRRKHYYRYEMGLVKIGAVESEALTFGTLLHVALETWWRWQHGEGKAA